MAFNVLIADDEPLEREALLAVISGTLGEKLAVRSVSSGTEALQVIGEQTFDLVFLDIRMPGRSGLDVAEELRSRDPQVAIVFVTAFDYFEYARSAIRLRAEDYLVKPVEDEAIQRVILNVYQRSIGSVGDVRFQEVSRYLERELLDDVIAGDGDELTLAPAFALLGTARVSGRAVVILPDLEHYPFRLENDRQRRAVTERVLLAIGSSLQMEAVRLLQRGHATVGYLIILAADDGESGVPATIDERVSRAVEDASARTGLSIRFRLTEPFEGLEAMSRAIRETRYALALPLKSGSSGEEHLERQLLRSLLQGGQNHLDQAMEPVWLRLCEEAGDDDRSALREGINGTLGFLVRTLRNRGIDLGQPLGSLAAQDYTMQELHREFQWRLNGIYRHLHGKVAPTAPEDRFSQRTRDFLNAHYRRDIGLPDLAHDLGLSESHCSRQVTRHFGITFRHLLRDVRLRAALQLLGNHDLTIGQVAEQSGFTDPNYFSRVFQEVYRMSPREYRNSILWRA